MKDVVIVFLLALVLGAAVNSYKWAPEQTSEPPLSSPGATPQASPVNSVSEATFDQQVLKSELPVLVNVGASWSEPCQAMAPVIDQLASENKGRLKVVSLDMEHNQQLGSVYGADGIPAFCFFKNGKLVGKLVGPTSKEVLAQSIEKTNEAAPFDVFASAPQPGNIDAFATRSTVAAVPPVPNNSVTEENPDVPMLDETGFDRDVIKSASPVLVFFCDTSEPCNKIWPTVQSVANKVADRYRVVRVDVAAHPALAQEYYVSACPTFIIFKDGKRYKQMSGVLPEQGLLSFLEMQHTASAAGGGTL